MKIIFNSCIGSFLSEWDGDELLVLRLIQVHLAVLELEVRFWDQELKELPWESFGMTVLLWHPNDQIFTGLHNLRA